MGNWLVQVDRLRQGHIQVDLLRIAGRSGRSSDLSERSTFSVRSSLITPPPLFHLLQQPAIWPPFRRD